MCSGAKPAQGNQDLLVNPGITTHSQMEVTWNRGTPSHYPAICLGSFHELKHPASLGYSHDYGNPHILTPWFPIIFLWFSHDFPQVFFRNPLIFGPKSYKLCSMLHGTRKTRHGRSMILLTLLVEMSWVPWFKWLHVYIYMIMYI